MHQKKIQLCSSTNLEGTEARITILYKVFLIPVIRDRSIEKGYCKENYGQSLNSSIWEVFLTLQTTLQTILIFMTNLRFVRRLVQTDHVSVRLPRGRWTLAVWSGGRRGRSWGMGTAERGLDWTLLKCEQSVSTFYIQISVHKTFQLIYEQREF